MLTRVSAANFEGCHRDPFTLAILFARLQRTAFPSKAEGRNKIVRLCLWCDVLGLNM